MIIIIILSVFLRLFEEEARELRENFRGASEDSEDGAALRFDQSQAEGGRRHHRSSHHFSRCSLRVYRRLAGAPAGSDQRRPVGPHRGLGTGRK